MAPHRRRWELGLRVGAAGVVSAVWIVAWFVRLHQATPNVDDYLYTLMAGRLWTPLASGDVFGAVEAFLSTGRNAPLVPALGAPLSGWGPDVVVLLQLPLLLALFALVFAIVERASGARAAFAAALLTTLSPPVLNWSLMVHMALASSVCALGCIDAYVRSQGFARRGPSVMVGVWIGLLSLSRSMAPIYVAMVCVAILLSVLRFHRRDMMTGLRNLVFGVVAAVAIAAPWYLKSGLAALNYLRTVGYSAGSGHASSGNPAWIRLESTWQGMGAALVILLMFVGVLAVVARARGRRQVAPEIVAKETRFVLSLFAGLVLAFLTTTNVPGTAFDLPVVVSIIPALILCLPVEGPSMKLLAPAGVLASMLAVSQAWLAPGWEGRMRAAPAPFYAAGFLEALKDPASRAAARPVVVDIARIVRDDDLFVTRDDAVVNVQGLAYQKLKHRWGGTVDAASYELPVRPVAVPSRYEFVLTGQSCSPYHRNIDRAGLESSLAADAWSVVFSGRLSGCNDVALWRRAIGPLADLVVQLRSDRPSEMRAKAADDIWQLGAEAAPAVDALTAALTDPNSEVRLSVVGALQAIGPPASRALSELDLVLANDPDALVREQAVKAIAAIAPEVSASVASLTRGLTDKEGFVRVAAAYALAEIGPEAAAAIPALSRLLQGDDDEARKAAKYAIGQLTRRR